MDSTNPIDQLKSTIEGYDLFYAGLPGFPRNFTRDSILSALLLEDKAMLREQLRFCGKMQGSKNDPQTGEEVGKIFHEYPGFVMENGLSTLYNACDTTALYLIGHQKYRELSQDDTLLQSDYAHIKEAASYILRHLRDGIFYEDPAHCGAKEFGLKVSYWKDSTLLERKEGKPIYPVAYPLAHIQNLAGLRSAAKLLAADDVLQNEIQKQIAAMQQALAEKLFDDATGMFYLAIDEYGTISGVSTDGLHALYYLEQGDISPEQIHQIVHASENLETPWGYRVLDSEAAARNQTNDDYHANTLWCWEQAIIHAGAKFFELQHPQEITLRIVQALGNTNAEILQLQGESFAYAGCDPQLWTIAAKDYFARQVA